MQHFDKPDAQAITDPILAHATADAFLNSIENDRQRTSGFFDTRKPFTDSDVNSHTEDAVKQGRTGVEQTQPALDRIHTLTGVVPELPAVTIPQDLGAGIMYSRRADDIIGQSSGLPIDSAYKLLPEDRPILTTSRQSDLPPAYQHQEPAADPFSRIPANNRMPDLQNTDRYDPPPHYDSALDRLLKKLPDENTPVMERFPV